MCLYVLNKLYNNAIKGSNIGTFLDKTRKCPIASTALGALELFVLSYFKGYLILEGALFLIAKAITCFKIINLPGIDSKITEIGLAELTSLKNCLQRIGKDLICYDFFVENPSRAR